MRCGLGIAEADPVGGIMSPHRTSAAIFEKKVARRLAAVFGLAVAVALFFSLTADEPTPTTASPSAYSHSALGYEALSESLSESGMRVLVSRWHSGRRATPTTAVLVLEPLNEYGDEFLEVLSEADGKGAPVVVGLPKWEGQPTSNGWVSTVALRPTIDSVAVLSILAGESLPEGVIYRADAETSLTCTAAFGSPEILHSLQLIDPGQAGFITPVITCSDGGILVGRTAYGTAGQAWVVADPDLWNTHGLARPANPPVAETLLKKGLGANGVILDETVHGFEHPPSIWQELTTFPLSLFSAHLAGLFLLSVFAAAARFGAPQSLPPRIPPGKGALIENTARLLDMGGHRAATIQGYLRDTVRRLAQRLSLPTGLTWPQQLDHIQQHCIAHGLTARPAELHAQAAALPEKNCSPRRALALAHRIRAMRTEITGSPHAD